MSGLYCVYAGALALACPALSLGSRVEPSPCKASWLSWESPLLTFRAGLVFSI